MGGDGGSIPQRCDMVKKKKKQQKLSKSWTTMTRWRLCQLTQQPLTAGPVVACGLGRLYIKEAVIQALLDRASPSKSDVVDIIPHIKSIRDVKDAILTKNPGYEKEKHETHVDYFDSHMTEFLCPIVGEEMNGTHQFCIIWTCGHVLCEKALKAVDSKDKKCLVCNEPYDDFDVIMLYQNDEKILADYQQRMEDRRLKAKKEKKEKKKAEKAKEQEFKVPGAPLLTSVKPHKSEIKDSKIIKRKLLDQERQIDQSVQDDTTKSKVFKSLFTSSKECKEQPRAHWVTYNPQYF